MNNKQILVTLICVVILTVFLAWVIPEKKKYFIEHHENGMTFYHGCTGYDYKNCERIQFVPTENIRD